MFKYIYLIYKGEPNLDYDAGSVVREIRAMKVKSTLPRFPDTLDTVYCHTQDNIFFSEKDTV